LISEIKSIKGAKWKRESQREKERKGQQQQRVKRREKKEKIEQRANVDDSYVIMKLLFASF